MVKLSQDPEFRKGIDALGEETRFMGSDLMMQGIKNAEAIGVPLLKEFGLYVGEK
jgi:hypothetical protein